MSSYKGAGRTLATLSMVLVLTMAIMLWNAVEDYQSRVAHEGELARHTAQNAAQEITDLIEAQRAGIRFLAEGRGKLLARMAADPADREAQQSLRELLDYRFNGHMAHTLASPTGELLNELGEDISDRCREDLRLFAQGAQPNRPYVHPVPERYHYDIMGRWSHDGQQGLLLVSFNLKHIARLLANNQPPGHRLFLVRDDLPRLIEADAEGGREHLAGAFHLTDLQLTRLERAGARVAVHGTSWQMVDIPDHANLEDKRRHLWTHIGNMALAFLLLAGIAAWAARRDALQRNERLAGEARHRQDLEDTVQRRTQALRASETLANLIIDTSNDAILVADAEGRILRANPQAEHLFACRLQALIGQPLEKLVAEDARQAFMERCRASFRPSATLGAGHQEGLGELPGLRGDGREFPMEASLGSVLFGGLPAMIVTLRDITQRKQAEAQLRNERDFIDAVVESAGNVIVVLDRAGRIVRFNRAAERITGYRFAEMHDRPIWDVLIPPEEQADVHGLFDNLMEDRPVGSFENEWVMRDGSRRLFAWYNTVLRDAAGTVTHAVALGYDITAQRAGEAMIVQDREQQGTLRELLEIILRGGAVRETLTHFLDRLLKVSWLALLPRGGIFLMARDGHTLNLAVSRELAPGVLEHCSTLPVGQCLCGQAAATGCTQFAAHVDARHEVVYADMPDHGHYCVPLKMGDEVLGVLVLYLPPAFQRNPVREEFIASVTDILASFLARKREEEALRDSEAAIHAVMDSLPSTLAVLNERGEIVRVNETWRRFALDNGGDTPTRGGVGLNYLDACDPAARAGDAYAPAAQQGIRNVLDGRQLDFALEYPCDSPRQARWFLMRVTPLRGMAGKGVVVSNTDITARKLAEKTLADQQQQLEELVAKRTTELALAEERTSLILRSSGDGLFGLDREGRLGFVNPVACRMLGYAEEALLGRNAHELIHYAHLDGTPYVAEDCPMHQAQLERHLMRTDNDVFWCRDGNPIHVEYAATPMFKGDEVIGVVVSFRDITERKHMEAALRTSEAHLSQAQAIAHVGSWHLDIPGDVLTWSEETYCMFGEPRGAPVNLSRFMTHIHPDDVERVTRAWGEALQGRPYDIEHRILTNGVVRWVREQAEVRFDAAGKPLVAIGAVQDISELKEAEHATREALDAARRLARAKSEFLANMSHEIRTPLNAVLGLARIGLRDNAGRDAQGTFQRILDAGSHLLGVINDILDLSKIEAGKVSLESRPFQLAAVIDSINSLIGDSARQKGLAYEALAATSLTGWVLGDAQRLRQILVNLLSNAVKFTQRGEVGLRVARAENEVCFQVTDTGIGMSETEMSRLFLPFEQADTSTTRKYGGTGLGLAISRDLARMMGGEITVESAPGVGSTFSLCLPLPAAEPGLPTLPAPSDQSAAPRLSGLRILAAEDVEVNRLILEDLLVAEGAQVLLAVNGKQALERLEEAGVSAFDAVLMDVQMPEMDGHEATRHIRRMAPGLPVIGLTAHALAEERERCLAAGMVEHVTKPIEVDVLVHAILRHARRLPGTAPGSMGGAGRPAPSPTPGEGARAMIDWAGLEARFGGKREFIGRLAHTAQASQADTMARLRTAAAAGDGKTMVFLAHSLKGLAGSLMAEELRALAARAEQAAKNGEAAWPGLAERLACAVEDLLADIGRHLQARTQNTSGEENHEPE